MAQSTLPPEIEALLTNPKHDHIHDYFRRTVAEERNGGGSGGGRLTCNQAQSIANALRKSADIMAISAAGETNASRAEALASMAMQFIAYGNGLVDGACP
jgi:hypothetical protein